MKDGQHYSSCDYLAALGLAATRAMQAQFLWALPVWILAMLQREANDR